LRGCSRVKIGAGSARLLGGGKGREGLVKGVAGGRGVG
jgi:hypothetical protein